MRDVRITLIEQKKPCPSTKVGDSFVIRKDKIFAPEGQGVCFYSLSAMMPFLAAWEMQQTQEHYATTLTTAICPMGRSVYRAERITEETSENL